MVISSRVIIRVRDYRKQILQKLKHRPARFPTRRYYNLRARVERKIRRKLVLFVLVLNFFLVFFYDKRFVYHALIFDRFRDLSRCRRLAVFQSSQLFFLSQLPSFLLFQTFFVQQFPVDFRTPLLIFYLRGELTDGDVFGFVSVAPVTRMMILERRKKKKRKMRQLSRTRERSFHRGGKKERRMREENGGEKKKVRTRRPLHLVVSVSTRCSSSFG